ncbi:MAG: phosphotransferase [Candidatus Diapherotrites archaeon]
MKRPKLFKVKKEIGNLLKTPISKVKNVEEHQTGLLSDVIFAKAKGKNIVLKKKLLKKSYPQNTEKVVLRYLGMRNTKIQPRLLAVSPVAEIQQKVGGNFFSRKDEKIMAFAKSLKELHSFKFEKFGTFGKGLPRKRGNIKDFFGHWHSAYTKYTASCVDIFNTAKNCSFTNVWLPKIQKVIRTQPKIIGPYLTKGDNSIIHQDLHKENILTRGRIAKLVDWDSAKVGDPALDIANFLNKNNLSAKQQSLFYKEYGIQKNHFFKKRVESYRSLDLSFHLLTFARAIKGKWGPRATKDIIIHRMAFSLRKFSELIEEPLSTEAAEKIVSEVVNELV